MAKARARAAGRAAIPPAEQPLLREIAAAPDPDRIMADVRKLAGFGTRHTLSETVSDTRGIGAARRWIEGELGRMSAGSGNRLEISLVSEVVSDMPRIPQPVEIVDVLALQRGSVDPGRTVVMCADIDSRASDILDATSDAPGANDNASGLAGLLEAARILTRYDFPGSIIYAALSGEEQGLLGGRLLARRFAAEGARVKAVLNNDMIGNIAGIDGIVDNRTARVFSEGTRAAETAEEAALRRATGGEVDSPSRNLARYIKRLGEKYVANLDVMTVYRLDRFRRGGHHRPFNDEGFPAVRIMEAHENYHRQHQDVREEGGVRYGDVVAGVDGRYAAKLTALNAVVLASLASAPPFPAEVEIEGAVSPRTTLRWRRPRGLEAGNLSGYKIYWRDTAAPQWTDSRHVGDVEEATLENVVIDNFFFGVSSVAKDGYESPVVFPGPSGSFGA